MARKVTSFKEGSLYRIEWLDHFDVDKTWMKKSEVDFDQEIKMITYGICIGSKGKYVTLSGTMQADDENPLHSQVFRCLKSDIVAAKEIKF